MCIYYTSSMKLHRAPAPEPPPASIERFEQAAQALKTLLGLRFETQVAGALGLSAQAWTNRRRRGRFPVEQVLLLAQQQPEHAVQLHAIVNAGLNSANPGSPALAMGTPPGSNTKDLTLRLSASERALVQRWRQLPSATRAHLEQALAAWDANA